PGWCIAGPATSSSLARGHRLGKSGNDELAEFGGNAGDARVVLIGGAPIDDAVHHAEYGQHGEAQVGTLAHAAVGDAGSDHLLKAALDAPAFAADAAPAGIGQIAALVDEDLDVVALAGVGRQVGGDQGGQFVKWRAGAGEDGFRGFDKAVDAAFADQLERGFLGWKVVVE